MQKIFCIGLPRTGSHSVVAAFRELGINAVHFDQHAERALPDWERGRWGNLPDDIEVLAGGPAVWRPRAFARLYPGCGFVVTERDCDEWIDSVIRWLSRQTPAPGSTWHTRRMADWGFCRFDPNNPDLPDILAAAYEAHQSEAAALHYEHNGYTMHIDLTHNTANELWTRLASLASRNPPPHRPFPHLNRSHT